MHGRGLITHNDGSSYEGIWENGSKIEGQGIYKYSNGNIALRSNYNMTEKYSPLILASKQMILSKEQVGSGLI